MFDRFRQQLLSVLRVPPEPEAPAGAPGSARVFRAAPNYYRLKLGRWALGQIATAIGIAISLAFLANFKAEADYVRSEREAAAAAKATASDSNSTVNPTALESETSPAAVSPEQQRGLERLKRLEQMDRGWRFPIRVLNIPYAFLHDPNNPFGRLIERSPWWLFPGIALLEFFGIAFYLLQLPATFALVRLEFESHWYIVTDRSLRIRWGLVTLREATMSFANIQQVTVSQGPLQRLLGLADVHVQSAGGGSGGSDDHKGSGRDSMHEGVFHGVSNANEIRDLILARLRHFRAAGLGDPEDTHDGPVPSHTAASATDHVPEAARTLLAEARTLRQTLT